jgi:hypothetical protein
VYAKAEVQADRESKVKKKSEVMSVSESGGVVYVEQENEHCCGRIPL